MRTIVSLLLLALHVCYGQHAEVTVIVRPVGDAFRTADVVCIAGNRRELGNWNPSAVPLERRSDSLWIFTARFDSGSVVEFKITGGAWENEAVYSEKQFPGNTIIEVTKDTTVILRPIFWKRFLLPPKAEQAIRGTVEYHRQLRGEGLNHNRDIIVWLPPSYSKNLKKHYPVLYMHDGQNVFDPSTAFGGNDWRVDEVADSLIKLKKIEEIIIVGIYNSPDRLPEYSDSPLGNAYIKFVTDVLKPKIDSLYRTKPGREHTGIMGSSLGGLASMLFVWYRPDVFGMAGCLSSSFWYDDEKSLRDIRAYSGPKKNIRIYLDCGGREKELISGYKRMVEILKQKGFTKGKDLEYTLDAKGSHNEHYWAQRVWRPLMFMYGKK